MKSLLLCSLAAFGLTLGSPARSALALDQYHYYHQAVYLPWHGGLCRPDVRCAAGLGCAAHLRVSNPNGLGSRRPSGRADLPPIRSPLSGHGLCAARASCRSRPGPATRLSSASTTFAAHGRAKASVAASARRAAGHRIPSRTAWRFLLALSCPMLVCRVASGRNPKSEISDLRVRAAARLPATSERPASRRQAWPRRACLDPASRRRASPCPASLRQAWQRPWWCPAWWCLSSCQEW